MVIPILLLLSLGVVVIYSSNPTLAIQQAIFGAIGIGLFYLMKSLDFERLRFLSKYLYLGIIILLIITFLLGIETRGSVRWIPLGPFNFQPSEFAKPILILLLADFWTKNSPSWKNIFKSLLICLPVLFLVFRQPDLGTTLTLFFIWAVLLFCANISFWKLTLMSLVALICAPVGWHFLQDYQKQRVMSFLYPTQDPQGVGFHVIQSTIAVGSGGIFGRGLGRGTQSRLQFLPEFRTDFIFAFISEELGLVGAIIILTFYAIIFIICFRILAQSQSRFGEMITLGVLSMLFFQIAVNVSMNTGLLPVTGITLPLLSYGGSSILTTLISLGIVASVSVENIKKPISLNKNIDTDLNYR